MSAGPQESNQLYDDINITPMLDLAYVLLVTFIILTTAAVQGVRVKSPLTQTIGNLAKPQTRAITVTADGAVYLDAYPVSLDQLRSTLAHYKAANPNLPVVLKGRRGGAVPDDHGHPGGAEGAGYHRDRAGDQTGGGRLTQTRGRACKSIRRQGL